MSVGRSSSLLPSPPTSSRSASTVRSCASIRYANRNRPPKLERHLEICLVVSRASADRRGEGLLSVCLEQAQKQSRVCRPSFFFFTTDARCNVRVQLTANFTLLAARQLRKKPRDAGPRGQSRHFHLFIFVRSLRSARAVHAICGVASGTKRRREFRISGRREGERINERNLFAKNPTENILVC